VDASGVAVISGVVVAFGSTEASGDAVAFVAVGVSSVDDASTKELIGVPQKTPTAITKTIIPIPIFLFVFMILSFLLVIGGAAKQRSSWEKCQTDRLSKKELSHICRKKSTKNSSNAVLVGFEELSDQEIIFEK
jgi:hypothetical protein